MIRTVAIAGLGLVGGSLGMALRAAGARVAGVDPAVAEAEARARGAADALLPSLAAAVAERPDVLVLAAAVDRIGEAIEALAASDLPAGLCVTDVGSVKAAICAAGERLAARGAAFVGGHPLAGAERGGLGAARADLFQGAAWVLCPPGGGSSTGTRHALDVCRELARMAGARPVEMDAARHDRIVASTSHLPHLLAAALAAHLGARAAADPDHFALAGRGLLDMTRIADGPTDVWRAILAENGPNVRAALEEMLSWLDRDVPAMLDAGRAARARLRELKE